MTKPPEAPTKAKLPRGRRDAKASPSRKVHQATTDDMQREGLGVAAKE
jgi:hypothetical protein